MNREEFELQELLNACSRKLGVVKGVHGGFSLESGSRLMQFVLRSGNMSRWGGGATATSSGIHSDPRIAFGKAIGELMERYAQEFPCDRRRVRRTSYLKLVSEGCQIVAIDELRLFPNDWSAKSEDHARASIDPAMEYEWIALECLRGRDFWVPLSWIESSRTDVKPFYPLTSSGTGAGRTVSKARLAGALELVERDTFLCHWWNRMTGSLVNASSLDRNLAGFSGEMQFVLLPNDTGIPVILCMRRIKLGGRTLGIVLGTAAALDAGSACLKAAHEAVQATNVFLSVARDGKRENELSLLDRADEWDAQVRDFRDSARLYWTSAWAERAEFLVKGASTRVDLKDIPAIEADSASARLQAICERIEVSGNQIGFADLTTRDVARLGFHVARACVPGFVTLNREHRFRQWGRRRLEDFPKLLGWAATSRSEADFYPYPHPLC